MNSVNINDSSNNEFFNQIPLKINGEDVIINNSSFQIPQIDSDDEENPITPSNYINVQRALEGFSNKINDNIENISQNTEDILKNTQNIDKLNSDIAEITGGASGQFQRDSALISNSEGRITYSSEATSADIAKLSGLNELLNTDDFYKSTLAGALLMLNSKTEASKRVLVSSGEQNLDTYLNAGMYYFTTKCTLVNQPADVPNVINGHLIVLSGQARLTNLTYCKQIFLRGTNYPDNKPYQVWERSYNATSDTSSPIYGWSPWVRYLTTADDVGGRQETITVTQSGTNLNDYKTQGRYLFSSNVTPTNIPEGVAGLLIVYKFNTSSSLVRQFWIKNSADGTTYKVFIRSGSNDTTKYPTGWEPWTQFLTNKDLNCLQFVKSDNSTELRLKTINDNTTVGFMKGTKKEGTDYNPVLQITGNGVTILGSGESPNNLTKNNINNCISDSQEQLYLTSDTVAHIYTNLGSIQDITNGTENSNISHWGFSTGGYLFLPKYYKIQDNTYGPRIAPDGNLYINYAGSDTTPALKGWLTTILNGKQTTITGAASTVASNNLANNKVLISNNNGKIAVDTNITTTELGYLKGVTSAIQTQLNGKATTTQVNAKAPTSHASTATTYGVGTDKAYGHLKIANNLSTSSFNASAPVALSAYQGKVLNDKINNKLDKDTFVNSPSHILATNANGAIAVSGITTQELGRLSGIRTNIQDQIDNVKPVIGNIATVIGNFNIKGDGIYTNAGSFTLDAGYWLIIVTGHWTFGNDGSDKLLYSYGFWLSDSSTGEPLSYSHEIMDYSSSTTRQSRPPVQQLVQIIHPTVRTTYYIVGHQYATSQTNTRVLATRLSTLKIPV